MSQVRQNYQSISEDAVNLQLNELLNASYFYLGAAFHFDRDTVALKNIHKFFIELSDSKRQQADKLTKLQNSRGGRCVLQVMQKPMCDSWTSVVDVLNFGLKLEMTMNVGFKSLHEIAEQSNDPHLSDFVEEELLEKQVELIKKYADLLTNAKRAGPNLGEYVFEHKSFE